MTALWAAGVCRCEEHGIECVVKRIDELTRGVTARDQYEVETRNIRYDLYAETTARTGAPSMLVGHHRGDVQENIICNLFKVFLGGLYQSENSSFVLRTMLFRGGDQRQKRNAKA